MKQYRINYNELITKTTHISISILEKKFGVESVEAKYIFEILNKKGYIVKKPCTLPKLNTSKIISQELQRSLF